MFVFFIYIDLLLIRKNFVHALSKDYITNSLDYNINFKTIKIKERNLELLTKARIYLKYL